MPTQNEALRLILEAIIAMREAGYAQEDVQELAGEAWEHLEGGGHQPHTFGHCTNCRRLIIGWSAYQWSILVREPCPRAASPGERAPIDRCNLLRHDQYGEALYRRTISTRSSRSPSDNGSQNATVINTPYGFSTV